MMQGMEKAVIILSTAVTRAGAFASDARRLNVALTRAKRHLMIVGGYPTHISIVRISTTTTVNRSPHKECALSTFMSIS